MQFEPTAVEGCFVASLDKIEDDRGYFARAWCGVELAEVGAASAVAQINMSQSNQSGLIRGLHWQEAPHGEAKFVRCITGSIFDVCADVRHDSPTFGKWVGIELNARNRLALVVPERCAHGYQALEAHSEVLYLTDTPYAPGAELGLRWDDPFFDIEWPVDDATVSDKDEDWPPFR